MSARPMPTSSSPSTSLRRGCWRCARWRLPRRGSRGRPSSRAAFAPGESFRSPEGGPSPAANGTTHRWPAPLHSPAAGSPPEISYGSAPGRKGPRAIRTIPARDAPPIRPAPRALGPIRPGAWAWNGPASGVLAAAREDARVPRDFSAPRPASAPRTPHLHSGCSSRKRGTATKGRERVILLWAPSLLSARPFLPPSRTPSVAPACPKWTILFTRARPASARRRRHSLNGHRGRDRGAVLLYGREGSHPGRNLSGEISLAGRQASLTPIRTRRIVISDVTRQRASGPSLCPESTSARPHLKTRNRAADGPGDNHMGTGSFASNGPQRRVHVSAAIQKHAGTIASCMIQAFSRLRENVQQPRTSCRANPEGAAGLQNGWLRLRRHGPVGFGHGRQYPGAGRDVPLRGNAAKALWRVRTAVRDARRESEKAMNISQTASNHMFISPASKPNRHTVGRPLAANELWRNHRAP